MATATVTALSTKGPRLSQAGTNRTSADVVVSFSGNYTSGGDTVTHAALLAAVGGEKFLSAVAHNADNGSAAFYDVSGEKLKIYSAAGTEVSGSIASRTVHMTVTYL